MAGFRGKNLRSGDLAEQLGLLLLQNVCLVAPIPRTEDVGIDVVATLIKDFDGHRYIAENSFFVQIKSSSIREIIYKEDEVKWLSELQLPYFIASVNRKTASIELYSTHYLWDTIATNPVREEIIIEINDCSGYDCNNTDKSIRVPTGPCILTWSLQTFENNKNFLQQFYELLKSHILITTKAIETRRVGVVELVEWKTGEKPVSLGTKINSSNGIEDADEIISPYFNSLLHKLLLGEDLFITRSLYRVFEKILEQHGHFTIVDGKKKLIPFTADLNKVFKNKNLK